MCLHWFRSGPAKTHVTSDEKAEIQKQQILGLVGQFIKSSNGEDSPYIIQKWLAGGGFGHVFLGLNTHTGRKVAIKMESKVWQEGDKQNQKQLYLEFGYYSRLGRDCIYIPDILFFGYIDQWDALVMQLLGPSLAKVHETVGNFSIGCTAAVAISLLEIFRDFHEKGLVFRDIKPDNFLFGQSSGVNAHLLFMIDLGLCKTYLTEEGNHIPQTSDKPLVGTPMYMSVSMHQGLELGRRDDLESIIYMLIFLRTGTLPWLAIHEQFPDESWQQHMMRYGQMKMAISAETLAKSMYITPSYGVEVAAARGKSLSGKSIGGASKATKGKEEDEDDDDDEGDDFQILIEEVRELKFDQEPDYVHYLVHLFNILHNAGFNSNYFSRAYDFDEAHQKRPSMAFIPDSFVQSPSSGSRKKSGQMKTPRKSHYKKGKKTDYKDSNKMSSNKRSSNKMSSNKRSSNKMSSNKM